MNFIETEPRASLVSIGNEDLSVQLSDGRTVTVPLGWFPRLAKATASQRKKFELIGGGEGIHWPDIDEDLSIDGLLVGWHPGSKSTRARRKGSSHGYFLNQALWLNQSPLFFRGVQSLQMLAGARPWSSPDAIIKNANQAFLLEAKWSCGGMTLQKLAGVDQFIKATPKISFVPRAKAPVRQWVRAFNPETEGRMARAA